MSKTVRKPAINQKAIEYELREKVKDLEAEVASLKTKLEELRKAKNTTVIKKEKEFITTVQPQRVTSQPLDASTAAKSNNRTVEDPYPELTKLRAELEALKLSQNAQPACDHEEIIAALQNQLYDLESRNSALSLQCDQLQQRLDQSYIEISQKEANHCEAEENMKKELEKKWQQMYAEWMRTTEAKIRELQQANDMMRRMLGPPS